MEENMKENIYVYIYIYTYICVQLNHYCTAEINTRLLINYISFIFLLKKRY